MRSRPIHTTTIRTTLLQKAILQEMGICVCSKTLAICSSKFGLRDQSFGKITYLLMEMRLLKHDIPELNIICNKPVNRLQNHQTSAKYSAHPSEIAGKAFIWVFMLLFSAFCCSMGQLVVKNDDF